MKTLNTVLADRLEAFVDKIREGSYGENDFDFSAVIDDFQDIVDDVDASTVKKDPQ